MDFLISGHHINPIYLAALGFIVGIFGGFFGVGGSFIAGPGLFITGLPMNFVVGTDLAHIVGKSIVATREHLVRGHVDIKLGLIMTVGTIIGTEAGAQAIQYLKSRRTSHSVFKTAEDSERGCRHHFYRSADIHFCFYGLGEFGDAKGRPPQET
ncbi:MAG: hypothetical protein DME90_06420 [Verrucomicrobia bacterium]|nr:MAG: hypothetical protein DME90_06420 [Verrucomicrobiota bacterium]